MDLQTSVRQRPKKEVKSDIYCRYYQIADITIKVESDLPMSDDIFNKKFDRFRVDGPGLDTVCIRHHFYFQEFEGKNLGEQVYSRPPWKIFKKGHSWIYLGNSRDQNTKQLDKVMVFNDDYSKAFVFNKKDDIAIKRDCHSLFLLPTDQVLIARLLADRQGFYIHSCGMIMDNQGILFVGNTGTGKSYMGSILKNDAELLCDDRIIVRKRDDGFRIYGTWSYGDLPDVSSNSAPLRMVVFLEPSTENRLIPMTNSKEIRLRLLECLVKPLETADWWDKMLDLTTQLAGEIPSYILQFDQSGDAANIIRKSIHAVN